MLATKVTFVAVLTEAITEVGFKPPTKGELKVTFLNSIGL
uniref:Uncharacterized protein n=1 Tax=Raoultella planticola TaxID=575 RepID=W8CU56_RAOPL|nr:hypothetical protein pKpNDM1_00596 [Raoultella planticola]QZX60224.1 hypothetical protein [Klebsiella michiganensis]UGK55114.1 Hypothetical protein [Raoultella ornithinolytica]UWX38233.1 hypothetical protein KJK04_p1145 [Klebsiella quasipneumoniae]UWX38671.1 hypothetical protein KK467_p1815 [Klebsiella pneumoniae]